MGEMSGVEVNLLLGMRCGGEDRGDSLGGSTSFAHGGEGERLIGLSGVPGAEKQDKTADPRADLIAHAIGRGNGIDAVSAAGFESAGQLLRKSGRELAADVPETQILRFGI